MQKLKFLLLVLSATLAAVASAVVTDDAGHVFAIDDYPGFDDLGKELAPARKEPRWFAWFTGPKYDNPTNQLAYACGLIREGAYAKACRELDALVRNWPTVPMAAKAQHALAHLRLEKLLDYEAAFREYRYLLDYYPSKCDYADIADRLYQIAGLLRQEGKRMFFVRFANTVDVRHAYEACVLRSPGAKWVPEAMLIVGSLREDEGKYEKAVTVYENLRNRHYGTPEARTAALLEARDRMRLLKDHAYNRPRIEDTIAYLKLAIVECDADHAGEVQGYLAEAEALLEEESWAGAKFYDSSTRTLRSAVNAYERFLTDYPASVHAEEARARLEVLKSQLESKGTEE